MPTEIIPVEVSAEMINKEDIPAIADAENSERLHWTCLQKSYLQRCLQI